MNIDYSVIIRTTGKAKEKYSKLLSSISNLCPKPREIIVVLPEGYDIPEEQLGVETYYFSPKGMVIQRMTGINKCKTKYALICDDDISFESDFVVKLHKPIYEGLYKISIAPLYSFLPKKGIHAFVDFLTGSSMQTLVHKDRYISLLRTTGYSYNRNLDVKTEYYETQSAAWTCFYAEIDAIKALDFETEQKWLDKNGYSALDDQTMFYKAWLMGYKTVVVSNAYYEHLDAKTSTRNNKPAALYSTTFNRVVFWHRFIYSVQNNFVSRKIARIAFFYRMQWMRLWDYIAVIRKKLTIDDYNVLRKGYLDGWEYIRSEEYKLLPIIENIDL